jgi:hypothetical protein
MEREEGGSGAFVRVIACLLCARVRCCGVSRSDDLANALDAMFNAKVPALWLKGAWYPPPSPPPPAPLSLHFSLPHFQPTAPSAPPMGRIARSPAYMQSPALGWNGNVLDRAIARKVVRTAAADAISVPSGPGLASH